MNLALGAMPAKLKCSQGVYEIKWNESGFRPPLCTHRLNWARRTTWRWWDDWDDTVLQTQDSKFEPWRSEAEHVTSRSRRLPTKLTFTRGWGRNIFCIFQTAETGNRTPNPAHLLKNVWMFLQHWATWCRPPSVDQIFGAAGKTPLINPFPQQLRAATIDVTMWLLWTYRLIWSVFAVYIVVCCKQTCLHDSICLGNRACFVFLSALTFFFTFLYFI